MELQLPFDLLKTIPRHLLSTITVNVHWIVRHAAGVDIRSCLIRPANCLYFCQQKRPFCRYFQECLSFSAAFYSLHDTIQVAGELGLSKFVYLVKKSKLHHVLSKIKPITIFIPSNFALEQYLETESGKKILENESALRIFIVMHVFGGEWPEMLIKQRRKLENFLPGKGREMNIKIYDKVKFMRR